MDPNFVTIEIARLLDKLQFNESCLSFFTEDDEPILLDKYLKNSDLLKGFSRPLYSQIIDWLRESHFIQVLQTPPVPTEAIILAKGKIDHLVGFGFYLYYEKLNPRIIDKPDYNTDFYKGRELIIIKALNRLSNINH